ncbi:MAG: glycosyltransferase family 2 protein [Bacteroidaceae bacterium]|nr:glycosyltransferase family 2 protein [Bacteroidaceae bacterium]
MEVSILIPVYGVEKYIAKCAESLFCQTFSDIEYVFVDDCTPDNSIQILNEVIKRYPEREQQVKIVRNEHNMGLGATRNVAIEASTGRFLMFVDSDDAMPADAVEVLYNKINGSNYDFVEGAFREESQQGLSAPVCPIDYSHDRYVRLLLCKKYVTHSIWGKMYAKTLFTDNNITFAPDVTNSEDYCTLARLAFSGKRGIVSNIVYHYRKMGDSFFSLQNITKNLTSTCKANNVVKNYYEQHDASGRFRNALTIGLIDMLRDMRRHNISMETADNICPFNVSNPFMRLSELLFRSRCPYAIANLYYLALKRIYRLDLLPKKIFPEDRTYAEY